jgi:hypothetical protein
MALLSILFIDRLLKYANFTDLKSYYYTSSQVVVAESFVHSAEKFHGIPQSIIVDGDKVFASRFL